MKIHFTFLPVLFAQLVFAQTEVVNDEYEKGSLKDGFKEGVWEYYDKPGELALKIDYTASSLLFLKPDTASYVIKIKDQWTRTKVDVQPRYIGSMNDFKKNCSAIKYPSQARANETAGTFYIVFEIDTLGKAGNYEVINDIGDDCSEAVISALKEIPNYWLTAQKDGKVYSSKFILPVTFKMTVEGREVKPLKPKTAKELPLAKELDEVVISILAIARTN